MTDELRRSEFAMHLREIRSRFILVAIAALMAFVFVGALRLGQAEESVASAVIQVAIPADIEDNGDITEFRTRQLGELARTAAVLDNVLGVIQLDLDRGQIEDRLDLELLDTPGFLEISARASSAADAATLANAVADELVDLNRADLRSPVESVTLVDPATADDAASTNGPGRAVRDAIVAALAATIVVGEGSVLLRIMRGRFSPTDAVVDASSLLRAPVVDLRMSARHEVVDFVIEHLRPERRVILLQLGTLESCESALTMTRIAGHLGDRVLLIDGDEGRSNLHGQIGLGPAPGMSELADGVVGIRQAIRPGGRQIGAAVMTAGDPNHSTHRAPVVMNRIEPYLGESGADLVLVSVTSASTSEQQAGVVEALGLPVVLLFDPDQHRIADVRQAADRLRHLGSSVIGAVLIGSDPDH
jgi:capsular polysaccharide biosynthesis protein